MDQTVAEVAQAIQALAQAVQQMTVALSLLLVMLAEPLEPAELPMKLDWVELLAVLGHPALADKPEPANSVEQVAQAELLARPVRAVA